MTSVVDGSKCVKCGACAGVCPVEAFHEGPDHYVVNPDVCIDCGVCISECPMNAIDSDDSADAKWIEINADLSKKCPAAV